MWRYSSDERFDGESDKIPPVIWSRGERKLLWVGYLLLSSFGKFTSLGWQHAAPPPRRRRAVAAADFVPFICKIYQCCHRQYMSYRAFPCTSDTKFTEMGSHGHKPGICALREKKIFLSFGKILKFENY